MAFDMSIRHVSPETAVVTMTGPLSMGTNLKIADQQIQTLIEQGVSRLIFDLTAVPYADSAGLGVLIHAYGLVNSRRGAIRIAGAAARVADLLRMTSMDTLLPMDATVEDGISALAA